MNRALLCAALAVASCTKSAPPAGAEPPVDRSNGEIPRLRVARVSANEITVDGERNEAAWARAGTTGGLVSAGDGRPDLRSQVQGSARFLYDDTNLYVLATVFDRSPSAPFQPTEVDPHLWERSSAVELMLQPGDHGDNRHYYELQVDTHRARWETLFDDYNAPITQGIGGRRFGHQEWSTHMRVGVKVNEGVSYTLELAIPWEDFHVPADRGTAPPRGGDVWRANVYSFRDGQRDSLAWSPLRGEGNFHRASRFGRIEFAP